MLSTGTLSTHLVTFGAATTTFGTKEVKTGKTPMAQGYRLGDETYGRKSMLYISCPDKATRRRLERHLEAKGAKVNRDYWPASSTVEVQVTYFKGWHHDE